MGYYFNTKKTKEIEFKIAKAIHGNDELKLAYVKGRIRAIYR
jgi:hypothetical protein